MKLRTLFSEGQEYFRNILRTLIYKANPEIFDQLDFYADAHFSDPLLFGYFNHLKGMSIEQIQLNNLSKDSNHIFSNEFGVVFIPYLGYFETNQANTQLTYLFSEKALLSGTKVVSHDFVEPFYLTAHNNIEVCLYSNPYHSWFLQENGIPPLDPCIRDMRENAQRYVEYINQAFDLIHHFCPEEYDMYLESTRRIVLYEKENIRSFVTRNLHGTIFLSVNSASNTPFFIEELVHQCSHNVFNAITAEVSDYLKVPPSTLMSTLNGNGRDVRDIFGAYHGVYTVSTGVNSILPMVLSHELDEAMQLELLGRLAIKRPRFRTGVQSLDFDAVFTEKGKALYNYLDQRCMEQMERHPEIFNTYNFSNQRVVFNFERFLEANQEVLSKENHH